MTTWRYKARDARTLAIHSDVIQADTDSAARSALRRAGLRPISLSRVKTKSSRSRPGLSMLDRHLRARRVHLKADFFDSLSILLASGIPLAVALRTLGQSRAGQRRIAEVSHAVADSVQGGSSLGESMASHTGWFDAAELAMINSGQRSGEMDSILQRLAERQARSGELSSKLIGALTYPLLVSVIGIGVTLFLSVKTLPELVGILVDAKVEPPELTLWVMHTGQFVWSKGMWLLLGLLAIPVFFMACIPVLPAGVKEMARQLLTRCSPSVFRRAKTAEAMLSLSELLDTGVALVDAVRIVSPTMRGVMGGLLAHALEESANRIEQGQPILCLFDDELWFSEEHRQLMKAGEAAGELPRTLARIGELELRASRRLLDRFASLLEPAAIVLLALLVGTVVMAAVLPLVRLQEIVG